jgi:hypothetical protein
MTNRALIAWIVLVLISAPACAPNRNQWMSQAATQQATLATESIGDVQRVKAQAREGAAVLNGLAAAAQKKAPAGNQQVAAAFARDAVEVSSGLQAIADSQTDAGFTNAVFAMCDPARKAASPRVGQVMVGIAAGIRNNPPANAPPEQQRSAINYFETFGERMIDIPTKCEQASNAMANASTQEQQAEAEHQTNVNRALTAAAVLFAGAVVYSSAVASRPVTLAAPAPAPTYTHCSETGNGFNCYGY